MKIFRKLLLMLNKIFKCIWLELFAVRKTKDINMPKLMPLPIKTKKQGFFIQIRRWIFAIREWEVTEHWEYELPDKTVIVIPKGFIFDGASIPRPFWAILSPTGLLLIPGLIHDFGYRYEYLRAIKTKNSKNTYKYGKEKKRKDWDNLFLEVGIKVNGMTIIDKLAWISLAIFGCIAWESNRKRNEKELDPPDDLDDESINGESLT